jgi:hypothetical protein
MAVRKLKPVTPGQRFKVASTFGRNAVDLFSTERDTWFHVWTKLFSDVFGASGKTRFHLWTQLFSEMLDRTINVVPLLDAIIF